MGNGKTEKINRSFKEIKENEECSLEYCVRHYYNGYKKIRIKLGKTNKPMKIWFNNFIEPDLEISIAPKKCINKYYITSVEEKSLNFNERNIRTFDLQETNMNNKELLLSLMQELKLVQPRGFAGKIFAIVKVFIR